MLRIITTLVTLGNFAFAEERQGLNFGLSFHIDAASESHVFEGKKHNSIESAKPHIGFVIMDNLNLGVSGLFESQNTQESYLTASRSRIEREAQTTLQGTQVFARFLFAEFMFFEAGFGIYNQSKSVQMSERTGAGHGSFDESTTTAKSVGYGHHLGAGLEIPVTNGFFVTSTYTVRNIQLRDAKSDGSVTADKNQLQKREVSFGLSHYLQ
jgi:hypothetical protein